ncbi:MAG: hypothetical protein GX871_02575, partial [Microbacteriaceae bacterium]|nr:hypothetical protein [Microbacteriaceae bacterium]
MTDAARPEASAPPAPHEAPSAPRARRWTLQRRLIVTVAGLVSLLFVLVALTSAATLGRVLEQRLDTQLWAATQRVNAQLAGLGSALRGPDPVAILSSGAQPSGLLIGVYTTGATQGAWISADGVVRALDSTQL